MTKLLKLTSKLFALSAPIALMGSFAAPANALVTNFGSSNNDGISTLQADLNGFITPGYDVIGDQNNFEWFTADASGTPTSSIILESSGFFLLNTFGIYNSSGTLAEVFGGAESAPSDGDQIPLKKNINILR